MGKGDASGLQKTYRLLAPIIDEKGNVIGYVALSHFYLGKI